MFDKVLIYVSATKNKTLPEAVVQRRFIKKDILKNFARFTGKHLCQSFSFNKVAGLRLIYRTLLDNYF